MGPENKTPRRKFHGEPDFQTPDHIVKAAIEAAEDPANHHYTPAPGLQVLREAIAHKTKKDSGWEVESDQVLVTNGGKQAVYQACATIINPGDEVILPAPYWTTYPETIALAGGAQKTVFSGADQGYKPTLEQLESARTSKTKAIMPVSLYGQTPDMNKINAIAKNNGNIPVIEDAAQSFGASFEGKKSCNLSTIGCTSFFPAKPLGCYGDGGAIFTSDDEIAKICREIRVHGQGERYIYNRVGVGGRMDAIQAAIVLAKLDRFDWEIEKRQEVAKNYEELIKSSKTNIDIKHVSVKSNRTSVYAQYTLLVKDRDAIQTKLNKANIPSAIYYPIPLNEQEPYKNLCFNSTPISHSIAKQVISLPFSPDLKYEDQKLIIDKLIE